MDNDLISRQEAIAHAISGRTREFEGEKWIRVSEVRESLQTMPSAQPEERTEERTETHACDSISRQAAIDAINGEIEINGYAHVVDVIRDLPSAQPDLSDYSDRLWHSAYERGKRDALTGWIPCSERLPETEVLCCDTQRNYLVAIPFEDESSNTGYSAEGDMCYMYDCIAWMPLPEPYREEDQNG